MPKRVAIVQSNYIPWKGYFDLIHAVDEFVLFDDVQYTRRDWRNRNRIKTAAGPLWLTIPVQVKGRYLQKVREVEVSEPGWASEHWKTIQHAYGRAAYFDSYRAVFEELYLGATERFLSEVNFRFLTALCGLLGIRTALTWSSQYELREGRSERLLAICQQASATEYLSGPAAMEYLNAAAFAEAGIALRLADYAGYPEHRQLYPPFEHGVSVLDLLFNEGPNAHRFLKTFPDSHPAPPLIIEPRPPFDAAS